MWNWQADAAVLQNLQLEGYKQKGLGHSPYICPWSELQAPCHIHPKPHLQSSNGHQYTQIFDQNWSFIKNWPKCLWVGHSSKPQNASELRLGLNIHCDPSQFHKRYLQDVGCFLWQNLHNQSLSMCLMTVTVWHTSQFWSLDGIRACSVMEGKANDGFRRVQEPSCPQTRRSMMCFQVSQRRGTIAAQRPHSRGASFRLLLQPSSKHLTLFRSVTASGRTWTRKPV